MRMAGRCHTAARAFWSGLFSAARKPLPQPSLYEVRHEGEKSWAIILSSTGNILVVNRRRMTQMRREDAERMVAVLDGADGADMLAVGP